MFAGNIARMVTRRYIDTSELGRRTGLPLAWLKREADANRIPCIRAGRRRMFDLEAVLLELAKQQKKGGPRK